EPAASRLLRPRVPQVAAVSPLLVRTALPASLSPGGAAASPQLPRDRRGVPRLGRRHVALSRGAVAALPPERRPPRRADRHAQLLSRLWPRRRRRSATRPRLSADRRADPAPLGRAGRRPRQRDDLRRRTVRARSHHPLPAAGVALGAA